MPKLPPYGSYCLLLCSHVSKVFQGTFFYHTTIEQGRTTHHPWVNEHPNDSKYGSLTNIVHLITSQQYPITKRQVLKTCGWAFESFIQLRVFVLMKRASQFPCAKIVYPFIFAFGNGQSFLIVNIFNCWSFPPPICHFF